MSKTPSSIYTKKIEILYIGLAASGINKISKKLCFTNTRLEATNAIYNWGEVKAYCLIEQHYVCVGVSH